MKEKGIRVLVLIMALLFLVTSLGFSGLVIWQMYKDRHQNDVKSVQTQKETPVQNKTLPNFVPMDSIPQLQVSDQIVGNGAEAKPTSNVTVHYTGAVAKTGAVFQSSLDTGQSVSFALNQVIQGWAQGVPGMKVGGTRRLFIPAALAYGANPPPSSGIPANADLVFDIQLLDVKN